MPQSKFKYKRAGIWEYVAFFSVITIIILNGFLAFKTINQLSVRHKSIIRTNSVILALENLRYAVVSAETGQRGYLLTGEDDYLLPYRKALDNFEERIAQVESIQSELPNHKKLIPKLITIAYAKIAELKQTVELKSSGRADRAMEIVKSGEGRELYREFDAIFEQLERTEIDYRQQLFSRAKDAEQDSFILFAVFFFISVILLLGAFIMQQRRHRSDKNYANKLEKHAQKLESEVELRTQELTVYSQELGRSNKELEDFAFVASHDLQEPLRKVRAFSSRIRHNYENLLDERGVDYLKRMDKAAARMSTLIEDLLNFSRIKTRGKEFSEVDLNKLIALVIDDLEVAIQTSNAKIEVADLPKVKSDESQMNQLFLNLLSNAIKFRQADISPVIKISHDVVEREVNSLQVKYHRIGIKDNGIGFDTQYKEKIFLPFQRLHARENYQGTGIGLAVCRRIVERHGGYISVQSKLDVGTTFHIFIPVVSIDISQVELLAGSKYNKD